MRDISAAAQAEITKQRNSPYLWLYALTLEYNTSIWRQLFATSHDAEVTWKGNTFKPWSVTHQQISGDASGSLPTMEIITTNVTREVGSYAWDAQGFAGLPFGLHLVSKNATGDADAILSMQLTATSCSLDAVFATVRLGAPPWFNYYVPGNQYIRGICDHIYRDRETCGYQGSLPDCDYTLFGPNGCVVHGDDEEANGQVPMHPRRYGGHDPIPVIPV